MVLLQPPPPFGCGAEEAWRLAGHRKKIRTALSVDADNPVRKLYERLGYIAYEPDDDLGWMVLELLRDE
jgi:hypothetical protein